MSAEPTITISRCYLDHLLNCLASQKFLPYVNADGMEDGLDEIRKAQVENQAIIDKAWNDGMELLYRTAEKELPIIAKGESQA